MSGLTPDGGLARAAHQLAQLPISGQDAQTTLEGVASLACATVPGCEAASVTLVDAQGRPTTPVSTSELALELDLVQYGSDQGPCLDAMRRGQVVRVDAFDEVTSWPVFSREAIDKGVHSSLSLPLTIGDETSGALNLYARPVRAFVDSEPLGTGFAQLAAVTLANALALFKSEELARGLTEALESRDVIGQAKGIIMVTEHVSADEAFDVLRRASQRSNRKLRDLAQDLVEPYSGGAAGPDAKQ